MKQVRDVDEFSKLFKVNIPYKPEFDYYIDTLSQSKEYRGLKDLVEEFVKFEDWVDLNGYPSIKKYKFHCLDVIQDCIKLSSSYKKYIEFDYSKKKFGTLDKLSYWEKEQSCSDSPDYLLSFDLKSANFNTIKSFGDDICDSWEDLCANLFVHPVLAKSKQFRQHVLGELGQGRNGKIQLMRINEIVSKLESDGNKSRIVFVSNDEICLSLSSDICDEKGFLEAVDSEFGIRDILNVPSRITVYAIKKIGKKIYKKVVLFQEGLEKEDRYTTLSGVPGNKFYRFFKGEVLNKDIEERDLFFITEGEYAKWVIK
jgi:hypothetical protein